MALVFCPLELALEMDETTPLDLPLSAEIMPNS